MSALFNVVLARHGETEWSKSGRHTGLTDLPLTAEGEISARTLPLRMPKLDFARVWTSPLLRARRTCEVAGFSGAEIDNDLVEWNYGEYEGKTNAEIKLAKPDWDLFEHGAPDGESPAAIAARTDRVVAKVRSVGGPVLLVSSGHFLRVFAARWCGLGVTFARHLLLDTGSVSELGYAHNNPAEPAIKSWNRTA